MNKMILNSAFLLIFKQRSTESIYCYHIFRQHFGRLFFLPFEQPQFWEPAEICEVYLHSLERCDR